MRLSKRICVILIPVILLSGLLFSCSSRTRVMLCKANNPRMHYNAKKNKSRYGQKYNYKNHAVRKDYVIKNGIAR